MPPAYNAGFALLYQRFLRGIARRCLTDPDKSDPLRHSDGPSASLNHLDCRHGRTRIPIGRVRYPKTLGKRILFHRAPTELAGHLNPRLRFLQTQTVSLLFLRFSSPAGWGPWHWCDTWHIHSRLRNPRWPVMPLKGSRHTKIEYWPVGTTYFLLSFTAPLPDFQCFDICDKRRHNSPKSFRMAFSHISKTFLGISVPQIKKPSHLLLGNSAIFFRQYAWCPSSPRWVLPCLEISEDFFRYMFWVIYLY